MASWYLAKSLEVLRAQINEAYPGRDTSSDGTIGDAAHRSRKSDHNPNSRGVVQALDITHDPSHGVDAGELANALRLSEDPRIKYIISNERIAGGANMNWRPYSGSNPHRKHFHISVKDKPSFYNNTGNWRITQQYGLFNSNLSDEVMGEPTDEYGIMEEEPERKPGFIRRNWGKVSGLGGSGMGLGAAGYYDPTVLIVFFSLLAVVLAIGVALFIWLKPDREKIKKWIWRKLK